MDPLSDLKNKLAKNKDNRNTAVARYQEADHVVSQNEQKLQRKVATLLENEKMEIASYREQIKSSMDRLNHQQQRNNEQLIELNQNLADMSNLKAVYERKREIMEQNHQEFLITLESRENELEAKIKKLFDKNKALKKEYKELSIKNEMKKRHDTFVAVIIGTFFAVVIGSFLGFGFVDVLRAIVRGIKSFFTI